MVGACLPAFACWRHTVVREGFETAFFTGRAGGGWRIEAHTVGLETEPFSVGFAIEVDEGWRTRSVRVAALSLGGPMAVTLETDTTGRWTIDGQPAPHLDGCLDVDLESSAFTNALPVHRLGLAPGEQADAPAAYIRATTLDVARLDQHYRRVDDDASRHARYEYEAPAFEFRCTLTYDDAGLVLDYPGLAVRCDP